MVKRNIIDKIDIALQGLVHLENKVVQGLRDHQLHLFLYKAPDESVFNQGNNDYGGQTKKNE